MAKPSLELTLYGDFPYHNGAALATWPRRLSEGGAGTFSLIKWNCKGASKNFTVDSRYLDFGYLEQVLISKRKSDPCFNIEI